jgi:hypothetical protein
MRTEHLSDDEIQEVLDKNKPHKSSDIQIHLENCDLCREALKQYQNLYAALENDPDFKLPRNFARSVAAKLNLEPSSPFSFPMTEIIIIVAGVLLALAAAVYFVDMKPIVNAFSKITLPRIGLDNAYLAPIKNLLSGLNGSLILLPFAGLALIAVAVFDRIIHKVKMSKTIALLQKAI